LCPWNEDPTPDDGDAACEALNWQWYLESERLLADRTAYEVIRGVAVGADKWFVMPEILWAWVVPKVAENGWDWGPFDRDARTAVTRLPDDPRCRAVLGAMLYRQGRPTDAVAELGAALAMPGLPDVERLVALCFLAMAQSDLGHDSARFASILEARRLHAKLGSSAPAIQEIWLEAEGQ
jgi:hypothetical protein